MNEFIQGLGYFAHKSSGFSAGLLIGGVLGAGTMLLLAPHSGKRMRAKIQQKSIELRDETSDAVEDFVKHAGHKARQTSASVRKQAKELEKSGKDVLDEQKKRLSTLVNAGKTAVQGS